MVPSALLCAALLPALALGAIDRQRVVSRFNVVRTSLIDNNTTPLQVGNGNNFAFNVDNSGMQATRTTLDAHILL
ncbi:hypothetical protein LY76DRAFT_650097 [Colletotrichum caudatum]|nr:hypothetical protein LY76DRAFT_650097 [Colletotrichum caudatum]